MSRKFKIALLHTSLIVITLNEYDCELFLAPDSL